MHEISQLKASSDRPGRTARHRALRQASPAENTTALRRIPLHRGPAQSRGATGLRPQPHQLPAPPPGHTRMVPGSGHMAASHQPLGTRPRSGPAASGRPQEARSIRLHLGLHHSGRAQVRPSPDSGQPAGISPEGVGQEPQQHMVPARPPWPVRPLRRTAQASHRARRSSRERHRLQPVRPLSGQQQHLNAVHDHGGS